MSVSIVRPKVSELLFLLYSRPLHPELFDVMRQQHVQRDDYQASICITDTCHLIQWQHDKMCLTELVTTLDSPLPQKRRLLACRLRGERTDKIQCAPAVVYQTSVTVERLKPDVYTRMHEEVETDARHRGIFHNFRPHHRLALSPISHIAIEARAASLLVQAFHTFPDDCTIIKSQSLFEFTRKAGR
jgi:hypothetical protein